MKDIQQIKRRRYLNKGDLDTDLTLTIADVREEDVARHGEREKVRFVAYFEETEKALVLKWTLAEAIEAVTGSSDMDSWAGQQIVIYLDPGVTYNGLKVGGIRVRAVSK